MRYYLLWLFLALIVFLTAPDGDFKDIAKYISIGAFVDFFIKFSIGEP